MSKRLTLLILLACFLPPLPAAGNGAPFAGPVQADDLEVIDGDTFVADARVWPHHTIRVNVRIRGIDAPEINGRCAAEKAAARLARKNLADLMGAAVSISNIGGAKYYGRVLADVDTVDGIAVASVILGRHLVRPYSGEKRKGWCGWRD